MTEIKKYSIDTSSLDFDPDKIREKYYQERDKRFRKDGFAQYKDTAGEFAGFIDT
ncbi:MAG: hypothetical protein JKY67_17460 [Pseudomonadales bacterium]|nr:hypothetical protein [Pseudomonadales bacterium]